MNGNISASLVKDRTALFHDSTENCTLSGESSNDNGASMQISTSRKQPRPENGFKQKISCEYYDINMDDFSSFEGSIQSFKNNKLLFLARKHLAKEDPVLVKRIAPLNSRFKDGLDKGRHARVVSCEQAAQNSKGYYQITVQFF